jgi:hypothetical protein
MRSQAFSATIKKVGINPYVDAPLRVSRVFGVRGYIPIRGTVNGKSFTQTLVPIGHGKHRLFINGVMRRAAKVDVGSRVSVTLRLNQNVRQEAVPGLLAAGLRRNDRAKRAWDALTASRRKEILRYLNFAKRPETLARNVAKTLSHLLGRKASKTPLAVLRGTTKEPPR